MVIRRYFLSYSTVDGADLALRLADALEAGPPSYAVWLDKRNLHPGQDWDEQIAEALRNCEALIFVMTEDSVRPESVCKQEWSRALQYMKPVLPLRADGRVEMPFRLGSRQHIDFGDFAAGLARLRNHLAWMHTPEGALAQLRLELADVRRELARMPEAGRPVAELKLRDILRRIRDAERIIQDSDAGMNRTVRVSVADIVSGPDAGKHGENAPAGQSEGNYSPDRKRPIPLREGVWSDLGESHLEAIGLANRVGVDINTLGGELVAGSIVMDSSICDYRGVDLGDVQVREVGPLREIPSHPEYILADMRASREPVPNRPKAHLVDWHAPIIDQGDVITLELARSDYWVSEATKRTLPRIQADIAAGRIDLLRMPRRLDVHLVVITGGDNVLLATQRGSHVASEPSTWMVSVGESMDWDFDRNRDGVPHPLLTARRCLSDRDELNLPPDLVRSAQFRLVALATEWSEMLANLIVLVTLPNANYGDVRRHFRRGENVKVDGIGFELESCVALLRSEKFGESGRMADELPVSDISRLALLAVLRSQFSLTDIITAASES